MQNSSLLFFSRAITSLSLLALAACGGSSGGGGGQHETISIASSPATIGIGANWQYTANASGTSQSVAWTATGGGTIDANTGLYIAPSTPANVTITAAAGGATQSTTVTVQANDPLGTVTSFTQFPGPNSCPPGGLSTGTCFQLAISCPGVADFSAYLKVYTPSSGPVGTVLFGVGTGGSGLYEDPSVYDHGADVVQNILNANYNTVQVSFGAPFDNGSTPRGWLTGPGGVRRLACRYATVADWVYRNPAIINSSVSVTNSAPMCATGNSGGSAVIAYAAYEYGLASKFAMIEPTSGPVMSRIDQGCSPCSSSVQGTVCASTNTHPDMCYESADAEIIDEAYQSSGATTPTLCTSALNGNPGPDAAALFLSDSIVYSPTSLPIHLPNTIVNMLFGDSDTSNAVPQGMVWAASIAPSPSSRTPPFECLSSPVAHDIPSDPGGAMTIATDITNACH